MKLARKAVLSGNALKLIAIAAMTVDHLTWVIFPGYQTNVGILLLHSIGRLTAPIMCFFIAEGYYYTHDRKRYAARLFLFALISHFAYNFAFGIPFAPFRTGIFNQTGVMWALACGTLRPEQCGIEAMAQNSAYDPHLRHIILCGLELHRGARDCCIRYEQRRF